MNAELRYTIIGELQSVATEGDPWPGDIGNRTLLAERLFELIRVQKAPVVFALNGGWGTGKTFFLKGFASYLKSGEDEKSRAASIYLNAWESDNLKNPLLYLYYGIDNAAASITACLDPQNEKLIKDNILKLGSNVLNILSGGLLGKASKGLSENCDKHPCNQYKEYQQLRESLKDYLSLLGDTATKKCGAPLILCLDELDRCRPDYAIEMLETIKHLFFVPNVVFVLGVDLVNLSKSIQAKYGDIAIDEYFRRFIQYRIDLPLLKSADYFTLLWETWGVSAQLSASIKGNSPAGTFEAEKILSFFKLMIVYSTLTPRQLETVARTYLIGLSEQVHTLTDGLLLAILCFLRVKDRAAYNNLISRETSSGNAVGAFLPYNEDGDDTLEALLFFCEKIIDAGEATNSEEMNEVRVDLRSNGEVIIVKARSVRVLAEDVLCNLRFVTDGVYKEFGQSKIQELADRLNLVSVANTDWINLN